jgi:hypothetical protein
MPQCKLAASQFCSQLKKSFSPQPGTEKTGIFPVFLTVAPGSMVGMFNAQRIPLFPAIRLKLFAETAFKSRIDVNGSQLVLYRDPLQTLTEDVHQEKAVGAAAEPHDNMVTIGDHSVPMNGLTDCPVQPLVCSSGMLLRHRKHLKSPKQRRCTLFDLFLLIFFCDFARSDFPKGHDDIFILR